MARPEKAGRVMTIILARHGRLAWDFQTAIPGDALAEWRRGEDDAPLDASHRPGVELQRHVRVAQCVVASTLRRSLESARLLAPSAELLIDACFREAELPSAIRSGLRLRPKVWAGLARLAWFCGWSAGVESFRDARERAAQAAAILIAQAAERGAVVLVGHGLMNVLIARQLRTAGWRGPRFPSVRHWAFGMYSVPNSRREG
jgi:broad specificity phosphatase PhoE